MAIDYVQVNTNIDTDTFALLEKMTHDDGDISRSAFFRRLIRQEWANRYSNLLTTEAPTLTEASK